MAKRDTDSRALSSTCGPGEYSIPDFIDESRKHNRGATFFSRRLDQKDFINRTPLPFVNNPFKKMSSSDICNQVVFGFGCSMQQHILYGVCLDGKCGKRAYFEKLMVDCNDSSRILGDPLEAERLELSKELNILTEQISITRQNAMLPSTIIVNDNSASLTPLHIAAQKGDLETIKTLATVDNDVNAIDSSLGRTAVHFAVARNNVEALRYIVGAFHDKLDLNVQDFQGDTPLHLACRNGLEPIVEILCDGGASPTCGKNKAGKLPIDEARTHKTYQILNLTAERNRCMTELSALQLESQLSKQGYSLSDAKIPVHNDETTSIHIPTAGVIGGVKTNYKTSTKFSNMSSKELWKKRPNRSLVESLKERLEKLEY